MTLYNFRIKTVLQREREEMLQDFIDNLQNENDDNDDDIFEWSGSESEMVKRAVMKLCIKFIDVNIETYVNEITDKPVDNTTDRNNNHRANLNIDNNRNIKIAFR